MLLVHKEVLILGPMDVVVLDSCEEGLIDEVLGFLPPQHVGARFTDVRVFVAQEVEQGLEDTRELDHEV